VLLNFPTGADAFADAAKALLGLHIVLAYPVLLWPCRQSIATLLRALSASAARRGAVAAADAEASDHPNEAAGGSAAAAASTSSSSSSSSSLMPRIARCAAFLAESPLAQSAALVLSSCFLAVLVPEVSTVFGLVGSTAATWQIFVMPGLLLRRWAQAWALDAGNGELGAAEDGRDGAPLLSQSLSDGKGAGGGGGGGGGGGSSNGSSGASGGTLSTYAPYGDAWSASDRERVWAGACEALRRSEAEGARDAAARVLPHYLSRSPAVLFALSHFLIAFGVFVMVASTSMYVWTTWLGGG
jgi:hypothetical protein